jgi:hypothetical protein
MSKTNTEDQHLGNQTDLTPAAGEAVLTIEEHAERLHIGKPVFAAVMQTERWAGGKKVSEAVFKRAVEGFLNAPMGGTK